jgi:hypothetical protein
MSDLRIVLQMVEKLWDFDTRLKVQTHYNEVKNNVMQDLYDNCECHKNKPGTVQLCERCLKLRSAIGGTYWDAGYRD